MSFWLIVVGLWATIVTTVGSPALFVIVEVWVTNNGALVTVCPALFVVVTNTVDCKVVVTSSVGIASVVEVLWLVEVLVGVSGPADVVVDEVDVVGGGVVVDDEVDVVEEVEEVVVVVVVVEVGEVVEEEVVVGEVVVEEVVVVVVGVVVVDADVGVVDVEVVVVVVVRGPVEVEPVEADPVGVDMAEELPWTQRQIEMGCVVKNGQKTHEEDVEAPSDVVGVLAEVVDDVAGLPDAAEVT